VKKLTAAHYDQALESIVGTVLGGVLVDRPQAGDRTRRTAVTGPAKSRAE
jgi:hypothetical protein